MSRFFVVQKADFLAKNTKNNEKAEQKIKNKFSIKIRNNSYE